jgi:ubiquinone/menaquinone biosynthesis C-methylase UbiE/alkylhydroperoxidase family enzyme
MRVPPWTEDLAPRSRELIAAIEARRGGALLNLDRMLIWSEPLARGWNGYLRAVRTELSLSPFLRELAICVVARLTGAQYEYHHHAPELERAGASAAQLAALDNPDAAAVSPVYDELQRAVIRFAIASTRDVTIPDAIFDALKRHLGPAELVELVATTATYNMVARFLVALQIVPESDGAKIEVPDVSGHYSRGDLLARLDAELRTDGVDPAHATIEALAPYDQFHGRGIEATEDAARLMVLGPTDHLLDVGSGIGGPARYFASHFGCRVTGIDLTPEFCGVAQELTRRLQLQDRVEFDIGDALAMPYADAAFDGAVSMNVAMNIADKGGFYREIGRVLKPGGWLVLGEIVRETNGAIEYPTPWAATEETSFLATASETQRGLDAAGFEVLSLRDTRQEALDFGARSRAVVERGEKPPHRAVMLVHREQAPAAIANVARALAEGRIRPIEVLARRRS